MSMDKRWAETFDRIASLEKEVHGLREDIIKTFVDNDEMPAGIYGGLPQTAVTKEDLTKIKGVGDALADEILKAMHR